LHGPLLEHNEDDVPVSPYQSMNVSGVLDEATIIDLTKE
jgi:hypothetical protein